jgi:SAM-dependent methyltransferase
MTAAVLSGKPASAGLMRFWPLPALLAWGVAWAVFAALTQLGAAPWLALLMATLIGAVSSLWGNTRWRRILLAAGFPVSMFLTTVMQRPPAVSAHVALSFPAWAWLLPAALLLLLYPVRSWRDAPMFPTPRGALRGLNQSLKLRAGKPQILDAGCGLGDGLRELQREYPLAELTGFEWSWPLRLLCAWRAPYARVHRADMWAADWSGFDLVYLFQRPESLPRAVEKASRELRSGAWMASLEFEVKNLKPQQVYQCADGRRLWLYQVPFKRPQA